MPWGRKSLTLAEVSEQNERYHSLPWYDDGYKAALPGEVSLDPGDTAIIIPWFQPADFVRPLANILTLLHLLNKLRLPYFIAELVELGRKPQFRPAPNVFIYKSNAAFLWHKENLVVQAVKRLPARFTKVVWLDKDVSFDVDDWLLRTSEMLNEMDFVQPFETVCLRRPDFQGCLPLSYNRSTVATVEAGCVMPIVPCGHPGLAMASHRRIIERLGLLEYMVVGSGDQLLMNALHDVTVPISPDNITQLISRLHVPYTTYRQDLLHFFGRKARLGYLANVTAMHAYHGRRIDKQHAARILMLLNSTFSGDELYRNTDGMWMLRNPAFWKPLFQKYFVERHEDDIDPRDLHPGKKPR
jgi:hypothetical protein